MQLFTMVKQNDLFSKTTSNSYIIILECRIGSKK